MALEPYRDGSVSNRFLDSHPALGVFLPAGIGLQFRVNVLLTIRGYIPGVLPAMYIIGTR